MYSRALERLLTLNQVSRTCTAPFDRLKIFLITRPPDLGGVSLSSKAPVRGVRAIGSAVARIYSEGGVRAFWTGNGLSVAKILPESAIKFLAYESSVRRIYMSDIRLPISIIAETDVRPVLGSC